MRGPFSYCCRAAPIPSPSMSPSSLSVFHRRFFHPSRCSVSVTTVTNTEVSTGATAGPPVRRRLVLLRHADSSWEDRSLRDHDRPISRPGRDSAANVSRKLQELGWIPELILSSDATRSRETLEIMRQHAKELLNAEVHFIPSFYSVAAMDGQTAEHLQRAICQYSRNEILTVMCMGHNKGWEEAASMFSGAPVQLSTCNAALLESEGSSWQEAFELAGFGGWKLHYVVKPDH